MVDNPNPGRKERTWKFGKTTSPKVPTSIPPEFNACFTSTPETKQTIACDTNYPASPFIQNKLHLAFCQLLSTPFALAPNPCSAR